METIKDFFEEVKNRLSNPLIGSFIIAWLICNWRIPIGLMLYKQSELGIYKSYFGLIENEVHLLFGFLVPMGVAGFYTYFFPYIKAKIHEHQATVLTNSENNILRITGSDTVRMLNIEKDVLNAEIVSFMEEKKVADGKFSEISTANYPRSLNGFWYVKSERTTQTWSISDDSVNVDSEETYRIIDFITHITPKHKNIAFTCEGLSDGNRNHYDCYFLKSFKSGNILRGRINGCIEVEFNRNKEEI